MIGVGDAAPPLSGQPVFGLPFDLHRVRGPTVVAFLRPPGTAQANAAIARLHELWPELDAAGGSLVAVTRGDLDAVRDWVPREHILFPVLRDADGAICRAWDIAGDRAWRAVSRGVGPLRRVASALRPGQAPIRPEDDQLPAEFVVGGDGRLRYAARGRSVLHQPDLPALRAALR